MPTFVPLIRKTVRPSWASFVTRSESAIDLSEFVPTVVLNSVKRETGTF